MTAGKGQPHLCNHLNLSEAVSHTHTQRICHHRINCITGSSAYLTSFMNENTMLLEVHRYYISHFKTSMIVYIKVVMTEFISLSYQHRRIRLLIREAGSNLRSQELHRRGRAGVNKVNSQYKALTLLQWEGGRQRGKPGVWKCTCPII